MDSIKNYTEEQLESYLGLHCRLLTTIQKDKCLLQLFQYMENKYSISKEECIEIYNKTNECTYLTNGEKCNKKHYQDRLCRKHFKSEKQRFS